VCGHKGGKRKTGLNIQYSTEAVELDLGNGGAGIIESILQED
jgi:hypothetical protein